MGAFDVRALGIDIGSATAKIVGVDPAGTPAWQLLEQAEPRVEDQVERFLARAQQEIGSLTGIPLIATGCGRGLVHQASRKVTEITCHARGIYHEFQRSGTLVDIGGQDSKVIRVGPQGDVVDFAMNDKCAAGTGRFLENMARRLAVSLEQMGPIALAASAEVSISSTCTVFAESEVISLIAHGVSPEPILGGLHRALIKRIVAMIRSVGLAPPLMLSGGVAHNPAIRHMLEEEMKTEVMASRQPQLVGAYGAALLALEMVPS